jgi:hypothetical protein
MRNYMPQMTRADIQQINDAVKNGNINAARNLLRASDDPRAMGMLDRLNAKYPPPPMAPDVDRRAARNAVQVDDPMPWEIDAPKAVNRLPPPGPLRAAPPEPPLKPLQKDGGNQTSDS